MSGYEAVDVLVKDQDQLPVEGAVVRFYTANGSRVICQHTTDAAGQVHLLLPSPQVVEVRVYKFSYSFTRVLLSIQDAPVTNTFVIEGSHFIWPESKDARLCIASGFFRDVSGAPKSYQDLQFIADFSPFVLEGSAVVNERVAGRTDVNGYIEVSLIRHAIYAVTMEGFEDVVCRITVPDRSSVNLPYLLFPRVHQVVTGGSTSVTVPPVSVAKGSQVTLPLKVLTTDGRVLDNISTDVVWTIEDTTIATIASRTESQLVIYGAARGTTRLLGARTCAKSGSPPVYYPDTPIVGLPIGVNVL